MKCPHNNSKVLNTRKRKGFKYRRKACLDCGARFTTVEVPLPDDSQLGGLVSALDVLRDQLAREESEEQK